MESLPEQTHWGREKIYSRRISVSSVSRWDQTSRPPVSAATATDHLPSPYWAESRSVSQTRSLKKRGEEGLCEKCQRREWKVDGSLFANKPPASDRKRGYWPVCWTQLLVAATGGGRPHALTSLYPRRGGQCSEASSSQPGSSFSSPSLSAFSLPSFRLAGWGEGDERTEEKNSKRPQQSPQLWSYFILF